jgi:hypothetical protein
VKKISFADLLKIINNSSKALKIYIEAKGELPEIPEGVYIDSYSWRVAHFYLNSEVKEEIKAKVAKKAEELITNFHDAQNCYEGLGQTDGLYQKMQEQARMKFYDQQVLFLTAKKRSNVKQENASLEAMKVCAESKEEYLFLISHTSSDEERKNFLRCAIELTSPEEINDLLPKIPYKDLRQFALDKITSVDNEEILKVLRSSENLPTETIETLVRKLLLWELIKLYGNSLHRDLVRGIVKKILLEKNLEEILPYSKMEGMREVIQEKILAIGLENFDLERIKEFHTLAVIDKNTFHEFLKSII